MIEPFKKIDRKFKNIIIIAAAAVLVISIFSLFSSKKIEPEEMLTIMSEDIGSDFSYNYSEQEETFYLYPRSSAMMMDLSKVVFNGRFLEEWDSFLAQLKTYSKEVVEKQVGPGYQIKIVYTQFDDLLMATLKDGEIDYDVTQFHKKQLYGK